MSIRDTVSSCKHKATLYGFHGQRSTGDDALASAIAQGLRNRTNISRFLVTADCEDLPQLPDGLEVHSPLPWLRRGRFRNQWRIRLAARRSKVFLLAGGANLHEGIDFDEFDSLADTVKRNGESVLGAVGVSVGPFHTQQQINRCKDFLRRLDFLTLRDSVSYATVSSYSLPYEPVGALDPALTLPPVYGIPTARKNPILHEALSIGVAICDHNRLTGKDTSADETRRENAATALLRFGQHHDVNITLFEFSGHPRYGDIQTVADLATRLGASLPVGICRYAPDPSLMWKQMARMDVMVAMRYHSNVFAYCAGVPFVMMDYHPKCTALIRDLQIPSTLALDAHNFTPDELEEKIELATSSDCPRPGIEWEDAAQKAEQSFSVFRGLV